MTSHDLDTPATRTARPRRTLPFPAVLAAVVVVQIVIIGAFALLAADFPV